jgi:hypothetical protein
VRLTAGAFIQCRAPDSLTTRQPSAHGGQTKLLSTKFDSARLLTISLNYDKRLIMLVLF